MARSFSSPLRRLLREVLYRQPDSKEQCPLQVGICQSLCLTRRKPCGTGDSRLSFPAEYRTYNKALPRQQVKGLPSCSPPLSFSTLAKVDSTLRRCNIPYQPASMAGFQIFEMSFTGVSDIRPGDFFSGVYIPCILRGGINRRTG